MKKIRKWGRSAPERPQQADERQPPEQMRRCGERHRTRLRSRGRMGLERDTAESGQRSTAHAAMTDAEAEMLLNRLGASDRRSAFAQALFPYNRQQYKSRGEWAKSVGQRVAGDIRTHPVLSLQMRQAGYEPKRVGYTLRQRILLIKFYHQNHQI